MLEEVTESWRCELCNPPPLWRTREFLEALPERAPEIRHPREILESPVFLQLPDGHAWLKVCTLMETPVLFVTHSDRASVYVWCWHCEAEHAHGPGDGHRVAHCAPGSPFTNGYMIRTPSASPRPE